MAETDLKSELKKALSNLRENSKERKFNQTVDLVINLQDINPKKEGFNIFINLPHKVKDKKVCGFLETKSEYIDTITEDQFKKYNDKKELKKLEKKYDFFIAQGRVMPKVATTFGRVLGPAGKMPSPQLGIINNADEKTISELKERINKGIKVRLKESSVKVPVGKEKMKDEEIIENILAVYNNTFNNLPKNKQNIKNLQVKFSMSKPEKIQIN